jgi:hypothetical protein
MESFATSDEPGLAQQGVPDAIAARANDAMTANDDASDLTTLVMSRSAVNDNYSADNVELFSGVISEAAAVAQPPSSSSHNSPVHRSNQPLPPNTAGRTHRPNGIFIRHPARGSGGRHSRPHVPFHNHIQLDLGGGRGVVSVPLNRQMTHMNDGVTTAIGATGSVNVRLVQVEPLLPQPAPDSTTRSDNSTLFASRRSRQNSEKEDNSSMERFKCAICYEYLKDPVGCGRCSSRFCRACLDRVFKSDVRRIQARNPQSQNDSDESNRNEIHPKCPTCRQEYERIVFDHALNHELHHGPTLSCRYHGCPEGALKLTQIAEHERLCGHVPMRCRYAAYGCRWTGKRCMIQGHELYGCKVAQLGPVIDQLRNMKADHGTRLEMVTQQMEGSFRMNNFLRQSVAKNQMTSLSDVFSIVHYCHVLTCAAPHFFFTKDKWAGYWRRNESRAAIVNVLIFSPFLLASAGTFLNGSNSFLNLLDILSVASKSRENAGAPGDGSGTGGTPTVWNDSSERLLEDAFLGFCAGLLGILAITVNFVDNKSSIIWRGMSIPHMGNPPVACDLLAVSTLSLLLAVMEYHDAGFKAFAMWMMVALCSTFFPALILSLSNFALHGLTDLNAPATAAKMSDTARSVEPLMFGLRFGLLATYFGMVPCLDAVIIAGNLPRGMLGRLSGKLVLKDCFLENIPRTFGLAYLGSKLAIWVIKLRSLLSGQVVGTVLQYAMRFGGGGFDENRQHIWATIDDGTMTALQATISESIFAANALLLMNYFIYCSFYFGIKMGNAIASTSHANVASHGVVKDYSFLGIMAFAGWAIMMTLILQL